MKRPFVLLVALAAGALAALKKRQDTEAANALWREATADNSR